MRCRTVSNCRIILIALLTAILFFIVSTTATPIPAVIRGTVVKIDEKNQTLTMLALCTQYECVNFLRCEENYCPEPAVGFFEGTVPDEALFDIIKSGDTIEATYLRFIITSYGKASPEPHQIGNWYAIARISLCPFTNELIATDIFGDPTYLLIPLAYGYRVSYNTTPLCPNLGQDIRCNQTTFFLNVEKNCEQIVGKVLAPGNSYEYQDHDGSSINVTLLKSEWSFMPSKFCPCTNLVIKILPDQRNNTAVPVSSPSIPFSSSICLAALMLCGIGWIVKCGKNNRK